MQKLFLAYKWHEKLNAWYRYNAFMRLGWFDRKTERDAHQLNFTVLADIKLGEERTQVCLITVPAIHFSCFFSQSLFSSLEG